MSQKQSFIQFFTFLIFTSCSIPDQKDDWYYQPTLSRLKINGYPLSIYKFSTSSMYTDSYFHGYTILDTSQAFTLNGIEEIDLDFLKELPANDTLKIIKLVTAKDRLLVKTKPVKTTFHQHKGLTIQTDYLERYNGYSSTNSNAHWFTFSALSERSDSLIFHNIKSRYKTNLHQESDSIVLAKENLYLNLDHNNYPENISAKVLIEEEADLCIYKKGSRVLESTVREGFVRIIRSYTLTPSDSTVKMDISFDGMFKQIQ